MFKLTSMAFLGFLISIQALALDLQPKSRIVFFCSEDQKSLMVSDGTETSVVQEAIVVWDRGLPSAGCTKKIVADITKKGFYCDGKYLSNYKGQQEITMSNESCQNELNTKPTIQWN